jgi:hypothetical protein
MRDITNDVTVDNIKDWIEIPDAPVKGQPYVWQFWEYDMYHGIQSVMTAITEESKAVITLQEQQSQHHDHGHTH